MSEIKIVFGCLKCGERYLEGERCRCEANNLPDPDAVAPACSPGGRQDGGNPATLGLLDEPLRILEEIADHMSQKGNSLMNDLQWEQGAFLKARAAEIRSQVFKIQTRCGEIESQENTGVSRDG